MSSAQLSPKKYIQTKARTLPIYKCLVNKDWQEAREASVMVMRRHVNGNVTTGIYLVDLLCVGIKDTFYFFNEDEQTIYDRLPGDIEDMYDEIDYPLAHNIIYAGHDFAMEYGIEPNKEFAVTKFILEEDNDNIPLIEIGVGDEEGLPHLVVHQPGEWSGALAKLQKNAGEGNYHYTISGFSDDDDFEDEDEFDDDEEDYKTSLDEYELGTITPRETGLISGDELANLDKINTRTALEKSALLTEEALRRFRKGNLTYYDESYNEDDEELLAESITLAYGVTESEEETFFKQFYDDIKEADEKTGNENSQSYFQDLLDKQADKLLVMAAVFESQRNSNGALLSLVQSRLEDLRIYPLATLELALANLLQPAPAKGFEEVYDEPDIKKLFPEMDAPGEKDLSLFWLLQSVLHLQKGDLMKAVYYYEQFAEADAICFLAPLVQAQITEAINKTIKQE